MQAQFDAASDAWGRGDCAGALPIYARLAADARIQPGSLPQAAIMVRRGECLVRTGHAPEGEPLLAAGLPRLRAAGADFQAEVVDGENMLGVLAMARWDHDTALAHFQAALRLEQGIDRLPELMEIAQVTAFDGGTQALAAVEEGLRLSEAKPVPDRREIAQWHWQRAKVLLNQGQAAQARAELLQAQALNGGEKAVVGIADSALFADLAGASMRLQNRNGDAYRYMAASGAGRLANTPFARPVFMEPPACGPDTGLEPEDVAVVEFVIGDDGQVQAAQTVTTAGTYAKAATFARAVSQWQWRPEDVAKMPVFFRQLTRVELRCTQALGAGGGSPLTPLRNRFAMWAQGPLAAFGVPAAPHWEQWLALAEAAQKAGDPAAELAARVFLAWVDLRAHSEAAASIARGSQLASARGIPASARNAARIVLAITGNVQAGKRGPNAWRHGDPSVLALADDPDIAQDPLAQDTALLSGVAPRPAADLAMATRATLARVADDSRLPDQHPLRQYAQLRLANDLARSGDLAGARQWFSRTGLRERQCALIGPEPVLKDYAANGYPPEALGLGFEGWVRSEFDITADGHTAAIRPVIAYPPFIFVKAATAMVKSARYQSSYRPDGGAACSAHSEWINFGIPGNWNTVMPVKPKSRVN